MNPYSKTALHTALASILFIGSTQTAQAVQLSTDGRGQVLLYPYYTTRADAAGNAYATLMSVVNATASAKAVRVRFLEGKNSREVTDFNLFLSPFDVWTAAVLPDTSNGGAKVGTFDLSCTLPAFSASPTAPFASFVNFSYSGANDDGAGTDLDRLKEGYFEIIEMGTYSSASTTSKAVTHVNGVPPCGGNLSDVQASLDAQPPSGGLFGTTTLLNVSSGTDYSVDAVALANFYEGGANYQPIGTSLPDLTQATPPMSTVLGADGRLYESTWAAGTADAVSAVLMHDSVMNEYVLDTATKSQTDWVMTMPTKRYYTPTGSGNAAKLFQRNFNVNDPFMRPPTGSCDEIKLTFSDREERTFDPGGRTVSFTGLPAHPKYWLCWAANVVTFNGNGVITNVFGSINQTEGQDFPPNGLTSVFQNGWLNMALATNSSDSAPNVHKLISNGSTSISGRSQPTTTGNTVTYVGLPVIGFAAISFTNGTLVVGSQNVLSNYGGSFLHKTNTLIQ